MPELAQRSSSGSSRLMRSPSGGPPRVWNGTMSEEAQSSATTSLMSFLNRRWIGRWADRRPAGARITSARRSPRSQGDRARAPPTRIGVEDAAKT